MVTVRVLRNLCIMSVATFMLSLSTTALLALRPRVNKTLNEWDVVGTFSQSGIFNYSIVRMSAGGGVLYLGARDTILALNPRNVTEELYSQVHWSPPLDVKEECTWKQRDVITHCFNFIRVLEEVNDTHLLVCGTYAFKPMCAFIDLETFSLVRKQSGDVALLDGRGISPYDPALSSTWTFESGQLYTGTSIDYLGAEHVIQRSVGTWTKDVNPIRQNSRLNDPRFVASAFIPEDPDSSEDDKVLFFFNERTTELKTHRRTMVPRIARVCKGDKGGSPRLFEGKWTSFLKAQLDCSLPSEGLDFSLMQDVFPLRTGRGRGGEETILYATFTAQEGKLSAVCKYDMKSVHEVFSGAFEDHRCATSLDPIPEPRPGQCLKGQNSWSLPDVTLQYLRVHTLMDALVQPSTRTPLLLSSNARYTRLAVERLNTLSGRQIDVLYLGTDTGILHKAVHMDGEVHLLVELHLFTDNQPVRNLLLDPREGALYVTSASKVLQLRTANCVMFQTCDDCLLARDPHCAWDPSSNRCRRVGIASDSREWLQDVENGNASASCPSWEAQVASRRKVVQKERSFELHCPVPTLLSTFAWRHDRRVVDDGDVYILRSNTLAVLAAKPEHCGTYECLATTSGVTRSMVVYTVTVVCGGGRVTVVLSYVLLFCFVVIGFLLKLLCTNGISD